MSDIKKILVPTDFSENSVSAYTHAQELAGKYGAEIDLLHVIPTMKYFFESLDKLDIPLDITGEEDLYPHIVEETEHKLLGVMDDYFKKENRGAVEARIDRKASRAIVDMAEKGGYDLIVMSAKGEHESDILRGSVNEKVIRHSTVPVFSVDKRLNPEGLKRILVPTDSSERSFACFPLALRLAETYDAEITLFHVLELHGTLSESIPKDPMKSDEVNIYETIIERLDDYLIEKKMHDVQIRRGEVHFEDQIVITDGASSKTYQLNTVIERAVSAHYGIEDYGPENADVIVMTTHGRTGLAHLFLGSTTENVAQHVDMPVVTVKPKKEELKERET